MSKVGPLALKVPLYIYSIQFKINILANNLLLAMYILETVVCKQSHLVLGFLPAQGHTAVFGQVEAELRQRYGRHILPPSQTEWVFINAGGWMGAAYILHSSLTEYVLFFGTAVDTSGHSGGWRFIYTVDQPLHETSPTFWGQYYYLFIKIWFYTVCKIAIDDGKDFTSQFFLHTVHI